MPQHVVLKKQSTGCKSLIKTDTIKHKQKQTQSFSCKEIPKWKLSRNRRQWQLNTVARKGTVVWSLQKTRSSSELTTVGTSRKRTAAVFDVIAELLH